MERRAEEYKKQNPTQIYPESEGARFITKLPQIIENGNLGICKTRAFIESSEEKAVIALNYKNDDRKWVLTAYQKYPQESAPKPAYSHQDGLNTNTSSEIRVSGGDENSSTNLAQDSKALEQLSETYQQRVARGCR